MNKIIIAGTRYYDDYELAENIIDDSLKGIFEEGVETIISGGARGADKLGETYAKKNNIKLDIYPALWDKYGKSAGYRRNEQMAQNATSVIVFWDGKSKGAEHMINLSAQYKLKGFYYNYVNNSYHYL